MTVQDHLEGVEGLHVGDTQSLMHMREWQGTSGLIESWVARICSAAISQSTATRTAWMCMSSVVQKLLLQGVRDEVCSGGPPSRLDLKPCVRCMAARDLWLK